MIIGLGSDHGGFKLKNQIIDYLKTNNIKYKDFGTNSKEPTDYPIYAKKVCKSILTNETKKGILICGTGVGISICANKFKGIRAALCNDIFTAKLCREHNNANILVLGERVIGIGIALEIVNTFLNTDFSNEERHIKRINMLEN